MHFNRSVSAYLLEASCFKTKVFTNLNFLGHNAPVTLLKLDPSGKVLLSGDSEGRDRSIRLWDLNSGTNH